MTNKEILEAIQSLRYLTDIENEEISDIAKKKIEELLSKLDFSEKADIGLNYVEAIKSQHLTNGLKQLTNGLKQLTIASKQKSDSEMQLISENERLKSSLTNAQKELNDFNCKIEKGELISKWLLDDAFDQINKCQEMFFNKRDLLDIVTSKWYFRLFGNLDKIKREIALEKAIEDIL